ncbi:MAG: sugar phosphate isomerase/epimerase family protein [Planctomycetota bacterium]
MSLNRRNLFRVAGTALAASAFASSHVLAADGIERTGEPRFQLGLAAYSFRKHFGYMKGKVVDAAEPKLRMVGFLDYCRDQGFDAAELTSYFFPPDASREYFLDLKREAYLRGVAISGTAIGNNFTIGAGERLDKEIGAAIEWIEKAAMLGAPHIRFFAGKGKELDDHPERLGEAIEAMKKCAAVAANHGIFLGVENHGNLRPDQLLPIIEGIDHPWVGINLDTGNFLSEDPYGDLEKCAPYAVNVQVKVSMKKPDGTKYPADLDRVAGILKDSNYQGFVILEYEESEPYEEIPRYADQLRKSLGQ